MTRIDGWCDGSGTYNTSQPACIGVAILVDDYDALEVSDAVDLGTNNLAELRAIRRTLAVLEAMFGTSVQARVISDSEYALGSTLGVWGAPRAHQDLIRAIRHQVTRMQNVTYWLVKGHSKVWGNELADWLAGEARRRWFGQRGIEKKPKKRPLKTKCIHVPEEVEQRITPATAVDWSLRTWEGSY